MSDFVTRLLEALDGNDNSARVVSGRELIDLLAGAMPDCGNEDCPIHGTPAVIEDRGLTQEQLDNLTADQAEELAIAFIGSAQNAGALNKPNRGAFYQKQADLWLRAAEILRRREDSKPAPEPVPVDATEAAPVD